jgi:hypothetical protein
MAYQILFLHPVARQAMWSTFEAFLDPVERIRFSWSRKKRGCSWQPRGLF